MPWKMQRSGSGWFVVNSESGKRMSKKPISRERASAQLRLLYAKMNSGEIKEQRVLTRIAEKAHGVQRFTKAGKPYKKNPGYMPGLAKHLGHKLGGDPHFFTKCMAEEEIAHYDKEAKSSICARAHYYVTGIWPGHHGGNNPNGPEGGESELRLRKGESRLSMRKERRADVSDAERRHAVKKYGSVHFADDANKKYPVDTPGHIRAAWNYIHQAKNAAKYADGGAHIRSAVIGAWREQINPKGPPGMRRRTALRRRKEIMTRTKGGTGSGFFGHSGRAGTTGGSVPGLGKMSREEKIGYHKGLARAFRNLWKTATDQMEQDKAHTLYRKHSQIVKKLAGERPSLGDYFFNIKERLKHGGGDQAPHGNWARGGGTSAASRGYRNTREGRAMAKRDTEREEEYRKNTPHSEQVAAIKRYIKDHQDDPEKYPNNKNLIQALDRAKIDLRILQTQAAPKKDTQTDTFLFGAMKRYTKNNDDWADIYRDANSKLSKLRARRRAATRKKFLSAEIKKVRDFMELLEMEHDEEFSEMIDEFGPSAFREFTVPHGGTVVFKDKNGEHRWVLFSSSAYQDHDREIVSTKALEADCDRADSSKEYGPLRWWHVPGVDIGKCDFNMVHGRVLIESGTFKSEALAKAVMKQAPNLQVSIGFQHPPSEPDSEGVFHHIRRFERSLTPAGRASNEFTSVVLVKGDETMATIKEKIEALKALLGDDKLVNSVLSQSEEAQKAAEMAGKAFKEKEEAEAPAEAPVEAVAEAPAEAPAETVKAPKSMPKDEEEEPEDEDVDEEEEEDEDMDEEEEEEDEEEEESKDFEPVFMGDLPIVGFVDMLSESLSRALDPMLSEVRTLHKEVMTVKEAMEAKVSEKDTDAKLVSELKDKLDTTAKSVAALDKRVKGLVADAPSAAKSFIASQDDSTVLTAEKEAELKSNRNLPHDDNGLSSFMTDFLGVNNNQG